MMSSSPRCGAGEVLDLLLGQTFNLPFEHVRILLAIAGTALGAYFDIWNNKNIPNWLLYGFLTVAFFANLGAYHPVLTPYAMICAAVVFGIMYLLYRAGQLGGADAFILASVVLLLPIQPQLLLLAPPSQYPELPFGFYLIVASGLSFMVYMLVRSLPVAISSIMKKNAIPRDALIGAGIITLAYIVFANFASSYGFFTPEYFIFITAVVALVVYFTLFKEAFNRSMVEMVGPKEVETEDILAIEQIAPDVAKKFQLGRLVDDGMRQRILKSGIKKLPVYKGLPPFIPHIFIGLAISLLIGNIIVWLAGAPLSY
jgi:Flp pilus assembly protein protease CpaA